MNYFESRFALKLSPAAPAERTAVFGKVRVSAVTGRLVRVEYSGNGVFTDEATQIVWNRSFPNGPSDFAAKYHDQMEPLIVRQGGKIIVESMDAVFTLRAKDGKFKSVFFKENGRTVTDPHAGNLLGTCRTLDGKSGAAKLGEGLISRSGLSVMEDDSLRLDKHSHPSPRESRGTDSYYFAYGQDYRGCLKDFYAMTGEIPFIPRYALSNWWSRYKAYTQEEYLALMARFDKEEIPIAVATVDMDWHWVDLSRFPKEKMRIDDPKRRLHSIINPWQKSGWTGYSWNTELFPDWKGFLRTLQAQGRRVTLNLHPADGVRAFEDAYEAMAAMTGVDPASDKNVLFDITDPKFVEAYFRCLHHPLEDAGVDFWWIDWQQGTKTNIPGLDPLWALNHYHTYDNKRTPDRSQESGNSGASVLKSASSSLSRRPLIMSRYAGPGSHRYPLGFSGDTFINWDSLRFQPYFTANAANIGYTWWSHDIGGHMHCAKDDELYLRWVQFGVFNPIQRLHSTSNEFMGKEPWKFRDDICARTVEALRLRHRLVPYIYTENRRSHTECTALCEPLYYRHPKDNAAYGHGNEYYFGSQLLCAPVTEPLDEKSAVAETKVWLPEGRWTDIFNGRIYSGGRELTVCRGLESIPVFAAAGAIVPLSLDGKKTDSSNPAGMELWIWRGNNTYTLYEDDGESTAYLAGEYRETDFTVAEEGDTLKFTITPKENPDCKTSAEWLPEKRLYRLSFRDIADAETVSVRVNGEPRDFAWARGDYLALGLADIAPGDSVEAVLSGVTVLKNVPAKEALIDLITKFQCEVNMKKATWDGFVKEPAGDIPGHKRYHAAIREILELA